MKEVKTKYNLFFLFSFVVIASCNNNDSNGRLSTDMVRKFLPPDTSGHLTGMTEEKNILDTLTEISFVKEANRQIDSATNHRHGITYIIDTAENEYNISAGYNSVLRFETRYIFSVDKKTRSIKVLDVISGDLVTVAEFEKLRKPH